jgi:hypothetical protein
MLEYIDKPKTVLIQIGNFTSGHEIKRERERRRSGVI